MLPGEYILGILQATADYFDVRKDAEITLEANPGTLDEHKLQCYRGRRGEPHQPGASVGGRLGAAHPGPDPYI